MEKNFCEFCGNKIDKDVVICPKCGKQLEDLKVDNNSSAQVIVNNTNTISDIRGKKCDKWVALLLCIFLGFLGAHKFYEGKTGMGVLYIFTIGLFGFGIIIDLIIIIFKSNPYYA